MSLRIVEALPGLEVGKGFDALTNDVKMTKAVLGDIGKPEGAAGQEGTFSFTIVKGSSEFRETLGVSANVSAGVGLFGASAKAKYAERCAVSSQSTVCVLSFEARNAFETFKGTPKLAPDLQELLQLNKTERFRERAGTDFCGGIWSGVSFCGTIRIESSTEAKDEEIALAIQASYGPFKASASIDKETSERLSKERIEILTFQSGGTVEPVFSLGDLFERAKIVARDAANGKAVPIAVTLESYNELELPTDDLSGIEQEHARSVLRKLGQQYDAVQDRINDINYVLRNPDYYKKFNEKQLSIAGAQLTQELNKIVEHADACGRDPGKCQDYFPQIPNYDLPERIQTEKPRLSRKERQLRKLRTVVGQIALLRQMLQAVGQHSSRRSLTIQADILELQKREGELLASLKEIGNEGAHQKNTKKTDKN